jgi:putative transposase
MARNHRLAKSISAASWSEFARQLEYKRAWHGKRLVRVDSFYPSAGFAVYAAAGTPRQRAWRYANGYAASCGTIRDRSRTAAKNILREG